MALGAWGLFVGFERPLRTGDREVLVTFEQLAEKVGGLQKVPNAEQTVRKAYLDGSYEVSYSYEQETLIIDSSVSHERSVRGAHELFVTMQVAMPLAVKLADADVVTRSDLYAGGDESYSAAIVTGGVAGGHVLVVREGKNVFMLSTGGVFLGDPAAFRALVAPRLAAMKALH